MRNMIWTFAVAISLVSVASGFQSTVLNVRSPSSPTTGRGKLANGESRSTFLSKRQLEMATVTPDASSETEWTQKRIHNTNWFRSGALLFAVGLMGASQASPLAKLSTQAGAVIHLLSYATWFGTAVYTTFIFGITAFRNLPRQTFGKLQAKLFPKYFALGSVCLFLQILTLRSLSLSFLADRRVTLSLGSALAAVLFNQFYLEPYTTKIMLKRHELEDSEGGTETDRYKELREEFRKTHGMSSLTNLIALCGTMAYGLVLAGRLVV